MSTSWFFIIYIWHYINCIYYSNLLTLISAEFFIFNKSPIPYFNLAHIILSFVSSCLQVSIENYELFTDSSKLYRLLAISWFRLLTLRIDSIILLHSLIFSSPIYLSSSILCCWSSIYLSRSYTSADSSWIYCYNVNYFLCYFLIFLINLLNFDFRSIFFYKFAWLPKTLAWLVDPFYL